MNKENMKAFVAVKIPVQGIKSLSYQGGGSGGEGGKSVVGRRCLSVYYTRRRLCIRWARAGAELIRAALDTYRCFRAKTSHREARARLSPPVWEYGKRHGNSFPWNQAQRSFYRNEVVYEDYKGCSKNAGTARVITASGSNRARTGRAPAGRGGGGALNCPMPHLSQYLLH
ncbi:hypothetical protein EVAR_36288_1 [Eumeta japonica]|uniref:Uncharacterized protein n=1 Tax=Eumeta variegata TaxID=151549 RepID=A0A4C1VHB6_EUMVA|nr:hypothetical protein EVAR_36288_1 [Eumeta japonica]